jgi:dinuclear metal center YbgI/SA1388 family protein
LTLCVDPAKTAAMTVRLDEVVGFLDATLEVERFRDYAPNGLQVEGSAEVERVITGVSACAALFDEASALGANLIVVHHGLIWGPGIPRVTGVVARRLRQLMAADISLAAYHLPLDDHPRLGNNVGLAAAIGLTENRTSFGDVRGHALGLAESFSDPLPLDDVLERIAAGVLDGQGPRFVFPHGPREVRRVGLCTGAASDLVVDAAAAGCDLFLTGELAERAGELARELQITLVAAGHHATEVFGPRQLAAELETRFRGLPVEFVDVPSPL